MSLTSSPSRIAYHAKRAAKLMRRLQDASSPRAPNHAARLQRRVEHHLARVNALQAEQSQ